MIFTTWENADDHASDQACHLLSGAEDRFSEDLTALTSGNAGAVRPLLISISASCQELSGAVTPSDLQLSAPVRNCNRSCPQPPVSPARGHGVPRGDRGGVDTNNSPTENKGTGS